MSSGVIVLGGFFVGLGIIRILHNEKIDTVVVSDNRNDYVKYSKYCNNFFYSENNKLNTLLLSKDFINRFKNWIIMPTQDYFVALVLDNFEELNKHFKIEYYSPNNINIFFDKRNT